MKLRFLFLLIFVCFCDVLFGQDSSNAVLVGRWGGGPCYAVAVSGNYVYFGSGGYLEIFDVSNPSNPVRLGRVVTPGIVIEIAISGSYAYVADGWEGGLRVIDVSNPTNPQEVGFYVTPGWVGGVAVSGSYAYVAAGGSGLRIIDISNPTNPREVGFYDTPGWDVRVAISGSYAYVVDREGLRIIDVNNPTNPIEVGFYDTPGSAEGVTVSGSYAYVADGDIGLRIIDISNPTNPREVGFYDTPGYAYGVAVSGSYAYVADAVGLRIIDISNPTNPIEVGFYDTPGYAVRVALSGSYAYVADWWEGLRIIDISNPTNPIEVGFYVTPGSARGVSISGSYAYVADDWAGLRIIDISNPTNPSEVGFYNTPGYAYGVAVSGSYAYVADEDKGLRIIDISNPTNPREVGFYDTPGYAYGVAVSGSYAYVADWEGGLSIIQVKLPSISLSRFDIDFGDVYVGEFKLDSVLVKNVGLDTLYINSAVIADSSFAILDSLPMGVLGGDSVYLRFSYRAFERGVRVDTCYLSNNSRNMPIVKISLKGRGGRRPYILSLFDTLDFGLVTDSFSVSSVKFYNVGDFDTVKVLSIRVDPPFYALDTLRYIAPGDSFNFRVKFAPSENGIYFGRMVILSDALNDSLVIGLRGAYLIKITEYNDVQSGIVKFIYRLNIEGTLDFTGFMYSIDGGLNWKQSSNFSGNLNRITGDVLDTIYWDSSKDLPNFESSDVRVKFILSFGGFVYDYTISGVGVDNLGPRFGGVKRYSFYGFKGVSLYWDRALDISEPLRYEVCVDSLCFETVVDSIFIKGLKTSGTYNFALKVYDRFGNFSSSSYSLKMPGLGDYNFDGAIDAYDVGFFVKSWSFSDFVFCDFYPYEGKIPYVLVLGDSLLNVDDLHVFVSMWDYSHISGLPKISFSDDFDDLKVLEVGDEFVFKPEYRGSFISYGFEVRGFGVSIDTFYVLRDGLSLVYFRDDVLWFDYSKFGGVEEFGGELFKVRFRGFDSGDSVLIRFRGFGFKDGEIKELVKSFYVLKHISLPRDYALYQNYPNPFNPMTTIRFDLPKDDRVRIVVYDILGREVKVLLDEEMKAGRHSVRFDASGLSSGVYFYKMRAGSFVDVKKMVIVK